jgi:hypothetical protein
MEFPPDLVDAKWVRWAREGRSGTEPTYKPFPGNHELDAYGEDALQLRYSELATTRGPVRPIMGAIYEAKIAANLATRGPALLVDAIAAVQWCAVRLRDEGIDAANAMCAGRPGSWEADALREVIRGGIPYDDPTGAAERVAGVLYGWVTSEYGYVEVAENYASAVGDAVDAVGGRDALDLGPIAAYCDPTDPRSGAAGWLTSCTEWSPADT